MHNSSYCTLFFGGVDQCQESFVRALDLARAKKKLSPDEVDKICYSRRGLPLFSEVRRDPTLLTGAFLTRTVDALGFDVGALLRDALTLHLEAQEHVTHLLERTGQPDRFQATAFLYDPRERTRVALQLLEELDDEALMLA